MQVEFNVLDSLWVEKYRPRTINDVILTDDQRGFFQKCLNEDVIPNTLLYGPPGSGKCHDGDELIDIYVEE